MPAQNVLGRRTRLAPNPTLPPCRLLLCTWSSQQSRIEVFRPLHAENREGHATPCQ